MSRSSSEITRWPAGAAGALAHQRYSHRLGNNSRDHIKGLDVLLLFRVFRFTPTFSLPTASKPSIGQGDAMPRGLLFDDLMQDLRICMRSLLRAPTLALTIVVTVGLGIGATTVIFSAVHGALRRPLPYENPDRLVRIYTDAPPNKFPFSVADFLALQAEQTQF